MDNKIFVVDCDKYPSCEMIDLNDEDPQWKYFTDTNTGDHEGGETVVVEKKIYVFGGENSDNVEVYDPDKGKHFTTYSLICKNKTQWSYDAIDVLQFN